MRSRWVDNTRGFAIYLVVLGHCIQYASHAGYEFSQNKIFEIIYSFHMPLFMLISGYLFWHSLAKYTLTEGIITKLKGIMVPCMSWGFITYILDVVLNKWKPISIIGYLYYTYYSNWFLWAVFYCSLVVIFTKYIFKNNWIGYIVILIFNYVLPVVGNLTGAKRLLPFFILGIVLKQYSVFEAIQQKYNKAVVLLVLVLLYILSMLFCNNTELITGTMGSLLVCFFFKNASDYWKFEWLNKLGQVSIGIYLFTGIIFYFFIKEYCRISESYRYIIRAVYIVGLSIILTILAYILCTLLRKNQITNRLFMGRSCK